MLYRLGPVMVLGATLIGLLIAGFFWNKASHTELVYWLTLILLSAVLRASVFHSYNFQGRSATVASEKSSKQVSGNSRWSALFWVTSMFAGSIWGVFPLIFFSQLSSEHILLLSAIFAGMIAVSASVGNIYPPSFYAFALPLVVPLIIIEFSTGRDSLVVTGVMLILYILVNVLLVQRGHRQFRELVLARYQNASLMEKLSIEKEVAVQAVHIKNRFIATASHDLRQPLHALGMFIGSLRNRENNSERLGIIDDMETSTVALGKLLHGLLDMSRLEAGVILPNVSSVSIRDVTNNLRPECLSEARRNKLTLEMVDTDLVIQTDPLLFERVLRNLLGNAFAYTQSGTVSLELRNCGEKTVDVVVGDTGPGIAEHERTRIFNEYYQINVDSAGIQTDQSKDHEPIQHTGLGLGLSIVKRLCEMLEIPVRIETGTSGGTEFILTVRLGAQSSVSNAEVGVKRLDITDRVLLIVDDDPLVLDGMSRLLGDWGAEVLLARSAKDAILQMAASLNEIDAVLCDYRLQGEESGLDVVGALREATSKNLPAVIISADTSPEVIKIVASSGLGLLHKPVTREIMRDTLAEILVVDHAGEY